MANTKNKTEGPLYAQLAHAVRSAQKARACHARKSALLMVGALADIYVMLTRVLLYKSLDEQGSLCEDRSLRFSEGGRADWPVSLN
jgi:hypothetical protein